jgi:hypothetical protein
VYSLTLSQSLVVEGVDRTHATMYLDRPLSASDTRELHRLAGVLPATIRVLRVQLMAADANQHTMSALRDIIRAWRPRGNVHLVFVGGFASRPQQSAVELPPRVSVPDIGVAGESSSPAHTAAFL